MGSAPDSPPGSAPEQPEKQNVSHTATSKRAADEPCDPILATDKSRQPVQSRKTAKEHAEVNTAPVNHFGVLTNGDLVELVLSHLRFNNGALANMMKVCTLFHDVGSKILWERADTRHLITCVASAARRQQYAKMIQRVQFFDHEVIWSTETLSCPQFDRVHSLELYGSSLCVSEPDKLIPFLNKTLKEMSIWTDDTFLNQRPRRQRDDGWIRHVTITCLSLCSLTLEVALDVHPAIMAAFFEAMPQLKRLRLGPELNPVLNTDAVTAVLTLPNLDYLSMDLPLTTSFLDDFIATKKAREILPQAKTLDIKFWDIESLAPGILLASISRLESLSITFDSTMPGRMIALHPAVFSLINTLSQLRALELRLASNTYLTCSALNIITSNEHLAHLTISPNDPGLHQPFPPMFLTGYDLLQAPITIKLLDALESLDLPTYIEATYDEALILTHQITAKSTRHIKLFRFRVNEAESFDWPSTYDGEFQEDRHLVWKASLGSFAPDPIDWTPRELSNYVDKNGATIPLDEVVTEGSYNHLMH